MNVKKSVKCEVEEKVQYLATCPIEGCECKVNLTSIVTDAILYKKVKKVGPWYCEECGTGINWVVPLPHKTVLITPSSCTEEINIIAEILDDCIIKRFVLLDLDIEGLEKPIQIIAKGSRVAQYNKEEQFSLDKYYYNEGTCPTNYLQGIEFIIEGDDADPHGIFQFNSSVDIDEEFKERVCDLAKEYVSPSENTIDNWEHLFDNLNAEHLRSLFKLEKK